MDKAPAREDQESMSMLENAFRLLTLAAALATLAEFARSLFGS